MAIKVLMRVEEMCVDRAMYSTIMTGWIYDVYLC